MRAVVQRVKNASVSVGSNKIGNIETGLLVLLGISKDDGKTDIDYIINKIIGLRIFDDENGRMNCNITQCKGSILLISQFTLYGDCRRGLRPSYDKAADPESAKKIYEDFLDRFKQQEINISHGEFGASMEVESINWGPVTIILDSDKIF